MEQHPRRKKVKTIYLDTALNKLRYTNYQYRDSKRFVEKQINVSDTRGNLLITSDYRKNICMLSDESIVEYIKRYNNGRFINEIEISYDQDNKNVFVRYDKVKNDNYSLEEVEILMRKSHKVGSFNNSDVDQFINTELLTTKVKQNEDASFAVIGPRLHI